MNDQNPLLSVAHLVTTFRTREGVVRAVDGVNLVMPPGQVLGLVGESGCGKSVASLSIMRLIPVPPGKIEAHQMLFDGEDLLAASPARMRAIRGDRIAMIFQEPMTALNPVFTVGEQISEVYRLHRGMNRKTAWEASVAMLDLVRIPNASRRAHEYPHQLSGGMRQRVMIAMALACQPQLLIADEPTTALDVTVQAQILTLMDQLRQELGAAILLITHALGVVAEMAHRVAVMYAGQIVEENEVQALFAQPCHPYTMGLLEAVPRLGQARRKRLAAIPGTVPSPADFPPACRFAPRCKYRMPACEQSQPQLKALAEGGCVRCFLHHPPEG